MDFWHFTDLDGTRTDRCVMHSFLLFGHLKMLIMPHVMRTRPRSLSSSLDSMAPPLPWLPWLPTGFGTLSNPLASLFSRCLEPPECQVDSLCIAYLPFVHDHPVSLHTLPICTCYPLARLSYAGQYLGRIHSQRSVNCSASCDCVQCRPPMSPSREQRMHTAGRPMYLSVLPMGTTQATVVYERMAGWIPAARGQSP